MQRGDLEPTARIPTLDGEIVRCGDKPRPVRTERQVVQFPAVSTRGGQQLAIARPPDYPTSIVDPRGQQRAIVAEGDAAHFTGRGERRLRLAGSGIAQPDGTLRRA